MGHKRSAVSQFLTFLHHFVCATAHSHACLRPTFLSWKCLWGLTARIKPPAREGLCYLHSTAETGHVQSRSVPLPPIPAVSAPKNTFCHGFFVVSWGRLVPAALGPALGSAARQSSLCCFSHPVLPAPQHKDEPKGSRTQRAQLWVQPARCTRLPPPVTDTDGRQEHKAKKKKKKKNCIKLKRQSSRARQDPGLLGSRV